MSAHPRRVTALVTFPWGDPPCVMRLRAGAVLDVTPGSQLEAAIAAAAPATYTDVYPEIYPGDGITGVLTGLYDNDATLNKEMLAN